MHHLLRAGVVSMFACVVAGSTPGCEVLVQLDRSTVDAGPMICPVCSDAADAPEGGDAGNDDDASDGDPGAIDHDDASDGDPDATLPVRRPAPIDGGDAG